MAFNSLLYPSFPLNLIIYVPLLAGKSNGVEYSLICTVFIKFPDRLYISAIAPSNASSSISASKYIVSCILLG